MASHTSGIESTTATKPKRDARGDARSVSDGRGDGRLLHKIFAESKADPRLALYAELLFGQAHLADSGHVPDPTAFGRALAELMVRAG